MEDFLIRFPLRQKINVRHYALDTHFIKKKYPPPPKYKEEKKGFIPPRHMEGVFYIIANQNTFNLIPKRSLYTQ